MDYNTFLTRDYKSLMDPQRGKKAPRWSRMHTLLVLATLMVISTLLVFMSDDAEATRKQPASLVQLAPVKPQQITIPLNFTIPTARPPLEAKVNEENWLKVKVRRGDNLAAIFQRHQISRVDLHHIMKLGPITATLKSLHPGQEFNFLLGDNQQLETLVYNVNKLESLHISRSPTGFDAKTLQRDLDKRLTHSSATINSSLFEAGKQAGLSAALIMEMVGIFGWDIDFAMDIRSGDHFTLLYEEQYLDGKKVNDGPVLAAEFTSQGRTYRAIRYTDAKGNSDYYTPEGYSMRKAFLRTPVDFRRISSRFGKRHHPTLNRMRLHKGVDYAAKRGTPIKASGDGKVIFKGRKGGYGRTIIIQHGGRYSTLYAHMSRFNRNIRSGKRVKQGQIIGYVGSSGRATGPHLHYEFRVNGAHRNPLTVRLPNAAPINAKFKDQFLVSAEKLLIQLNAAKPAMLALN